MSKGKLEDTSNEPLDFIFDFGANRGQNLSYYLLKAKTVVAVEANPLNCEKIEEEYKLALLQKRLFIENRIITDQPYENGKETSFYVHKKSDVLSMKDIPKHSLDKWKEIKGICACPSSIISKYLKGVDNQKIFCKFDLESFDYRAINQMFNSGIYPDLLSVEMHDSKVFGAIAKTGFYKSFTIIEGPDVGTKIKGVNLAGLKERKFVNFLPHMAGPFGNDISGIWISENLMRVLIKFLGGGWRDLHSRKQAPSPIDESTITLFCVAIIGRFTKGLRQLLHKVLPKPVTLLVRTNLNKLQSFRRS
jgi:FkbM family methyltransferase